jgi:hypothetical protein
VANALEVLAAPLPPIDHLDGGFFAVLQAELGF